jgi:hypothetical protein
MPYVETGAPASFSSPQTPDDVGAVSVLLFGVRLNRKVHVLPWIAAISTEKAEPVSDGCFRAPPWGL